MPRRDHEYGGGAGLSKLDVFCFELSKLFVNSGATDIVLVTLSSTAVERAIAQCTSRWAMARGHRLNTSIVLAAVHGLSGLFRAVSAVEPFTLSPPSHSVPVPNRPTRLCGRKATLNEKVHGFSAQTSAGMPSPPASTCRLSCCEKPDFCETR